MKTKNIFCAALSMAVALMMTACSNDENNLKETPTIPQVSTQVPTQTPQIIPYTVTINNGAATTRATVDDDNKTLRFAAGDKLYITGTDIKGVLDLKDGDAGKFSDVTFSGDLIYSGEGSPAADLELTAMLVSAEQCASIETANPLVTVNAAGAVTLKYPNNAYCTNVNDAVQKYSRLTGTSTYSAKSFSLPQQTSFLNFVITFDDGTTSGTELSAVVSNNGTPICTANVTTTTESDKVVAKFVLPVPRGTELNNATVKIGEKDIISFGKATLSPKVYNVKRTQAPHDAINGKFTINSSGDKVYFSKGNLQARKDGTWSWRFAPNQWDRVGNNSANTNITGDGTTSAGGAFYVDLFGWSTSDTHPYLGIHNSTDNSTYSGSFFDWGSASEVTATIGTGWRTLTGAEWDYLIKSRTTTSTKHYCKAQVNGKPGVILLPDDWNNSYYTLNFYDTVVLSFDASNIDKISLEDWNNYFVSHGAVFLPTTGQRSGTVVENENGRLYYWSSTSAASDKANQMYILGDKVAPNSGASRKLGNAVRLVRTAH